VKIIAISDMHGVLPEIEPCDLLILGGDIAPFHDHSLIFQRSWFETNFRSWCEEVPARAIVLVAGNHDFIFEANRFFSEKLQDMIPNLVYLENDDCVIGKDNLKVWGSPYVPAHDLINWAFLTNELQLERMYEEVPSDVDILISHSPAYGCGDKIIGPNGFYAGSGSLRKKIKEIEPKVFICGHIHEGYGAYKIKDTLVYNVSIMNELYKPVNKPRVINL
jgi:Icc-related predicted phosphoesterase